MAADPSASCPYCSTQIVPTPPRSRKCPHCRAPIVVRTVEGRKHLLREYAVPAWEAEQARIAHERSWMYDRDDALGGARVYGATEADVSAVERMPLSPAAIRAAKDLQHSAAQRAALREMKVGRLGEAAVIYLEMAQHAYEEAGEPEVMPERVVTLRRAWSDLTLRSYQQFGGRYVTIYRGECCTTCRRARAGKIRIADELAAPTLPHADCAEGICACDYSPVVG